MRRAPDWIVDRVERIPGGLRLIGRNLNFATDHPDHRFRWSFSNGPGLPGSPVACALNPRFDFSSAELVREA